MARLKDPLESALWYQRTRAKLIADYGKDADLMAGLIAATSPQKSVAENLRLAKEVYKRYCLFDNWESVPGLNPKSHIPNIRRVLESKPLCGLKVRAFTENLKGDLSPVTIDTILWNFYCPGVWITPNRHKKLVQKIKRAAKRFGLKPAEYQAIIWVKIRGSKNAVLSMFDNIGE